jgi:hypothetical protein
MTSDKGVAAALRLLFRCARLTQGEFPFTCGSLSQELCSLDYFKLNIAPIAHTSQGHDQHSRIANCFTTGVKPDIGIWRFSEADQIA